MDKLDFSRFSVLALGGENETRSAKIARAQSAYAGALLALPITIRHEVSNKASREEIQFGNYLANAQQSGLRHTT